MSASTGEGEGLASVVEELLAVFQGPSMPDMVRVVVLLASGVFLLLSLLLNIIVMVNICYKKRIQVSYFCLFLLCSLLHLLYFLLSLLSLVWAPSSPLLHHLPPLPPWLQGVTPYLGAGARAALGGLFLMVAALTVERFLSPTVPLAPLRHLTNLLTCLLALAGPALLLAFHVITGDQYSAELWFGVEIAVYIIAPLLVLTVFGTVNYCKVSLTNRLLPSHQVQAIKLNIGVTIATNICIFLFLVQECLALWLSQLEGRGQGGQVKQVESLVQMGHNLAVLGVGAVLSLLPCLYFCLTAVCCQPCCCPAINELEELEVNYTEVAREERC